MILKKFQFNLLMIMKFMILFLNEAKKDKKKFEEEILNNDDNDNDDDEYFPINQNLFSILNYLLK